MKQMKRLILILLPIAILGCIEPYDFEADEVTKVIIVDAELSDSLFLQSIKLSYLNNVTQQQFQGIEGATIFVEDDLGNEVQFFESTEGVYVAPFEVNRDRKYRLDIDIVNGGRIFSDFESVPPPIKMDSVVFEEKKESFVNDDGKNRTINVVKAYGVANISDNEEDLFLRFGNIETIFLFEERKKMVTFPPPKACYVYNKGLVPEVNVFEVKANSNNVAVKSHLFTKPIGWEFGSVTSIKADLISMNRSNYEYWKNIEKVYSQDGNINNPPPARIGTNLSVENRPPVLGLFSLTSISSDVVFVAKSDLGSSILLRCGSAGAPFPSPYPDECNECLLIEGATTLRPVYW